MTHTHTHIHKKVSDFFSHFFFWNIHFLKLEILKIFHILVCVCVCMCVCLVKFIKWINDKKKLSRFKVFLLITNINNIKDSMLHHALCVCHQWVSKNFFFFFLVTGFLFQEKKTFI